MPGDHEQRADSSSQGSGMALMDLPDECILRAMRFLESSKDILGLEATCKRMWRLGYESIVWAKKLAREFDLSVEATTREGKLLTQGFYASTTQRSADGLLRFTGVFTDGGCDNNFALYWVDHLFTANNWHSYCSAYGANINCIGVMLEPRIDAHLPDAERHRRNYIIKRCLLPHGLMTGRVRYAPSMEMSDAQRALTCEAMDRLSTSELEHLLSELFMLYQQGSPLGHLLFHGCRDVAGESARIQDIILAMRDAEAKLVRQMGISSSKDQGCLMDGQAIGALAADPAKNRYAGVVEKITVNRVGNFSCPVSSGAIFIANVPFPEGPETSFGATANRFSAIITSNACKALCSVTDPLDVVELVSQGALPPIVASDRNHAGAWIEFDPEWRHPDDPVAGPRLRPVVWFRFWELTEAYEYWSTCVNKLGCNPVNRAERRAGLNVNDAPPLRETYARLAGCVTDSQESLEPRALLKRVGEEIEGWAQLMSDERPEVPSDFGRYENNFVQGMDENGNLSVLDPRANINKLEFALKRRRGGNCAVVKLIDQEDLMTMWMDNHEKPNIDVTHVAFQGRQLRLPLGVQLQT